MATVAIITSTMAWPKILSSTGEVRGSNCLALDARFQASRASRAARPTNAIINPPTAALALAYIGITVAVTNKTTIRSKKNSVLCHTRRRPQPVAAPIRSARGLRKYCEAVFNSYGENRAATSTQINQATTLAPMKISRPPNHEGLVTVIARFNVGYPFAIEPFRKRNSRHA